LNGSFALFERLCVVGNRLDQLRALFPLASEPWCATTDVLQLLDEAIDALVLSPGQEEDTP
jgi:hypothetical protein